MNGKLFSKAVDLMTDVILLGVMSVITVSFLYGFALVIWLLLSA